MCHQILLLNKISYPNQSVCKNTDYKKNNLLSFQYLLKIKKIISNNYTKNRVYTNSEAKSQIKSKILAKLQYWSLKFILCA